MEKFSVTSKWGFSNKPEDLQGFIARELCDDRPDTIDQLRAEVSKLQDTLARLLVTLYANVHSPSTCYPGLTARQLDDVLGGAGIGEIKPVQ